MQIRSAVLQEMGRSRPYADSRPLVVEALELAAPGPNELLVRMEAAGLCHSDLSVIEGNRPRPVPMALGHEATGIIVEVGANVTLRLGQRVVMTFLPRCGECRSCALDGIAPCEPGSAANAAGTLLDGGRRLTRPDGSEIHHHLGVSGFSTYAVVDQRSVVAIGDDVPPEVASTLSCAVLTGGGAVLNAGHARSGDRIAIVGLGGVGMAALLTALTVEPAQLIAVDLHQAKLDLARDLGAETALTPDELAAQGVEADLVIECAGSARALETAITAAAVGGRVVTVGLPPPDARVSVSPLELVAKAKSIIGCYLGSAVPSRDIPIFADLWRSGRLPVEKLVSASIGLDDVNEAMDELAAGSVLRQIIRFDAPRGDR